MKIKKNLCENFNGYYYEIDSDLKFKKTFSDTIKYKLTEIFSVLFKKKNIFKKVLKDESDLDFSPDPCTRE